MTTFNILTQRSPASSLEKNFKNHESNPTKLLHLFSIISILFPEKKILTNLLLFQLPRNKSHSIHFPSISREISISPLHPVSLPHITKASQQQSKAAQSTLVPTEGATISQWRKGGLQVRSSSTRGEESASDPEKINTRIPRERQRKRERVSSSPAHFL